MMHARKNPFDLLVDDLLRLRLSRVRKIRTTIPAMTLNGPMLKALIAGETLLTQKRKRTIFVTKNQRSACTRASVGSTMAKAIDALHAESLTADQRGRLMLALGNVDPAVVRKAKRDAVSRLKAVEGQLEAGATASHLKAATALVREAQALMASGMSDGDHAALGVALSNLRATIEGSSYA
jgi:hypothetical protein